MITPEYREMFALSETDLAKKILDYCTDKTKSSEFKDFEFDLVLNLNDLFMRQAHKPTDFHINAIKEMTRVGKEVRIFPLLDDKGEISPLIGPVLLALQNENYGIEVKEVPSHLYEHGNAMLRVWAKECVLAE